MQPPRVLLACLLVAAQPAFALSSEPTNGILVDLGVGAGGGGIPLRVGLGWQASAAWWVGRYDEVYALGRYWSFGATLRQDYTVDGLRTAPMLEIRRGNDLLVAGVHGLVAGGPLIAAGTVGVSGRLGVGVRIRRHAYWGITLRVEGGVDWLDGSVGGQFGVLVSGSFARPTRKIDLGG